MIFDWDNNIYILKQCDISEGLIGRRFLISPFFKFNFSVLLFRYSFSVNIYCTSDVGVIYNCVSHSLFIAFFKFFNCEHFTSIEFQTGWQIYAVSETTFETLKATADGGKSSIRVVVFLNQSKLENFTKASKRQTIAKGYLKFINRKESNQS